MAVDADIICCDVCQIVFSQRSSYNRHRRQQHPQTGNLKSPRNRKPVRNIEVDHPNIQPRPTKRGTSDLLPRTNIVWEVAGGADTGRDTAKATTSPNQAPRKRVKIVSVATNKESNASDDDDESSELEVNQPSARKAVSDRKDGWFVKRQLTATGKVNLIRYYPPIAANAKVCFTREADAKA